MAYADPQTITINAIANSLPRTASGVNTGEFTKDDSNVKLSVQHAYGKRVRRVARVTHRKVAPDPFLASTNVAYSASIYMVADVPPTGYTVVEIKQIVDGFLTWLSASSGANITKLLGGEN